MRAIKNPSDEIKKQAHENVKGFDHSKLCYNNIFYLLDDNGVFYNAVNDILKSKQPNDVEIKLNTFKYSYVKENDMMVYPKVDLYITVTSDDIYNFVFSVTPFNAQMELDDLIDIPLGNCDAELTRIWWTVMKGIFKDEWIEAFKQYCKDVKNIRLFEIEKNARAERLKNQQNYDDNINSIS